MVVRYQPVSKYLQYLYWAEGSVLKESYWRAEENEEVPEGLTGIDAGVPVEADQPEEEERLSLENGPGGG